MHKLFLPALALAGLIGCAAPVPVPPAQQIAASESTDVCTMERPTGTNLLRKVCKTAATRAEEKQSAEEGVEAIRRNRTVAPERYR